PAGPRDYGVINVLEWVGDAGVLGVDDAVIVRNAGLGIDGDIFQHGAEADRVPDLRLVLLGKLDGLGVAAAFEVENAVGTPAVFVVANEPALGIGGNRGLAGAGKPEIEGGHAVPPHVGPAVHRKHVSLGQEKIHNRKN